MPRYGPGPVYVGPRRGRKLRRLLLLVVLLNPRRNKTGRGKQQSKGVKGGRRRTDRATSKNAWVTNPKKTAPKRSRWF